MKKIKFHVATNRVGSDIYELIEVEDDVTDDDIEQMYKEWVWDNIEAGWWLLDGDK